VFFISNHTTDTSWKNEKQNIRKPTRKTMKTTPRLMKASNNPTDCTQSDTHLSLTPQLPYFFDRRLIIPIFVAKATI